MVRRGMNGKINVKRVISVIGLFAALGVLLVIGVSCSAVGANIRLEKLSLGAIALDGKPIDGLPSREVNLNLDVAAQTIKVSTSVNGTVLTILPSGATIEVDGDSISLKGLKSDQVKVEWSVPTTAP